MAAVELVDMEVVTALLVAEMLPGWIGSAAVAVAVAPVVPVRFSVSLAVVG